MTVSTGAFPELLWPGIKVIWGNTYNDYPALYPKCFTIKKSDKAFEKEQGVTGLPLAAVKDQGSPIAFVDPFQGFQKEYVNVTYGIGASVTKEMFADEQYGYINSLPEMLARSMRQTEETTHFNVLNTGFAATPVGADGVSLFNASHPMVGGATALRNQLATASDLSMTALETAFTDIMDFYDDQALKIRVLPKKLVVPTALWAVARKIMETEKAVGSADNDKNVLMGALELIVSPWLTDTDAWFIITDAPNGLVSYTRQEAELDRDNDFDTKNLKFTAVRRWISSWTDWRGAFGSAGA